MKRVISLTVAIIMLVALCVMGFSSCSARSLYSEGDGGLEVLCTIFPAFDLAREVGGDKVTLTLLQDTGTDMHSYTPTSATLDALASADVFIYIGGVSDEAWVYDAINASGNEELITLCLIDTVELIHAELEYDWVDHAHGGEERHSDTAVHSHDHGDHEGHDHSGDEHIWTSIKNASLMVEAICEVFTLADGENSEYYARLASDYTARLDGLDRSLDSIFSDCDIEAVVFADRFPFVYLFHDYHIPYIAAFSGCSTEINASFETQIGLIRAVERGSLGYVLTIEGEDKVYAKTVAMETGCKIASLDSMQSVTRRDIENGATYLGIMQKNIEVLGEVFS